MCRPVSKINQTINCHFLKSMRNAYWAARERKRGNEATTADQCYACNKFFVDRKSLERHLNVCEYMSGIAYKFENQSMQIFFDNIKFMGDLPFSIYFDFQTTLGKKIYNFDEESTFSLVSYPFVVAFHPPLNI